MNGFWQAWACLEGCFCPAYGRSSASAFRERRQVLTLLLNGKQQFAAVLRDVCLSKIGGSYLFPPSIRWRYLRLFGLKIDNAKIFAGSFIGGKGLAIGQRSFVNYRCFFDTSAPITIGTDVNIGMGCHFVTSTHAIGSSDRRGGQGQSSPIVVGDGAWLGAGALVLPGVQVGRGSIVAAGSVVTRDVPDNVLVAGVPAKYVRHLSHT